MRLFMLSIFIAALSTGLVAIANFTRDGAAAFSNGPWLYIGYFVFMVFVVFIGTVVMQKIGGK